MGSTFLEKRLDNDLTVQGGGFPNGQRYLSSIELFFESLVWQGLHA